MIVSRGSISIYRTAYVYSGCPSILGIRTALYTYVRHGLGHWDHKILLFIELYVRHAREFQAGETKPSIFVNGNPLRGRDGSLGVEIDAYLIDEGYRDEIWGTYFRWFSELLA